MAGARAVMRRAREAATLTGERMQSVETRPAESARPEPVTDEEAADLWAFHLALADGLSEEEFRQRESDVYRRLQVRYLTQAETRERLNQLPDR